MSRFGAPMLASLLLAALAVPAPRGGMLDDAESAYRSGDYRSAAERFRAARQAAPADARAGIGLGRALLKLRDWDGAIAELQRVVAAEPANARAHLWLGRALGEKASRASKFSAFGLARRVRAAFETAVRIAPGDLEARFDLLQFLLEAPGIVGGGKEKARAELGEIARRDPLRGYVARARMHRQEKKWAAARAEYERAIDAFPDRLEARLELAELLLVRGEPEAALAAADRGRALAPGNPAARLLAAAARVRLRRELPVAGGLLTGLVAGPLDDPDPSFAEVHYSLAELRTAQADTAAARRELTIALGYDPDYTPAREALARLHP